MIDCTYTAKRTTGETVSGIITAESTAHARQLLRDEELFPISVTSASGRTTRKRRRRGRRVHATDILMVTSQLAIMSRSGLDIADALKSISEECDHEVLQTTLQQIYEAVAGGETVSAAMAKYTHIFGQTYIVAIQAAEASGRMTEVLDRLTALLRYEIRLKNTLRGVMTYPIILFSVALLVCTALVLFVLPQFAKVFADLDRPVPPTTKFLLDVSVILRTYTLIALPVIAVTLFGIWKLLRTDSFRMLLDRAVQRIRGVGPAIQCLAAGRVFTLMGTMLQSGIPLLDSLALCRTATGNRLLQRLFSRLEEDVINGRGISAGMSTADCLPAGAAQMVSTAERTGRLAEVIQTIGQFYEEEGERQIKQAMKFLEPAIILTMGVFVSFIVMSVMLPLLDVTETG